MPASTTETFERAVGRTADGCHRTDTETFEETLSEVVETPAVGTPLSFEGVSFGEVAIEMDPTPAALTAAETGVTPAGLGIADYGTVTIDGRAAGDELVSLYPPRHVVVVDESDIVPDMAAAFERFEQTIGGDGPDSCVLATGPSATADMGTLVEGVHGPTEVHVVVVER